MLALKELFFKHIAQTSDSPILLEIERAKGIYLYDNTGKSYLDLISGISVNSLGHSHPKIIKAATEQINKNMHLMVYGEYIQQPQVNLATKLAELTNQKLDSTFFVNSGSEAVEAALKLAKRYTKKSEIIACENAYHGSTHAALSLISNKEYTKKFEPLLNKIKFIRFNHPEDAAYITNKTACVIIEPIQGEAGYIPAKYEFLKSVREACDIKGALLIFDEVQTGMGRTGSFFAYESYGIIPDILVLAKAFGGGMPLGAFISSKKIMHCLSENPALGHITTFGGHPVSCATSMEAINIIEEEKLISQIAEKEKLFRDLLKHKKIIEVRGKGLMLAIQLDSFDNVKNCISYCLEKGVIIDWFLFCDSAIRISPPLIISNKQIEYSCATIIDALNNF
jgi:acetylornithine/succinyldiaminopimelate/putrescine aminotransferase